MFVLPGAIAMIAFFIVRLSEVVPALRGITVTQLMIVGFVGLVIDIRQGRVRWPRSPFMWPALGFMAWAFIVLGIKAHQGLPPAVLLTLGSSFWLFFLIALGAQSLRGLVVIMFALSVSVLFATAVAAEQGTQPTTCVMVTADGLKPLPGLQQQCERSRECEGNENVDAGTDFGCERVGWAGTTSIGGRVRYRGLLEDPNELAWVVSMVFPLFILLVDSWNSPSKYLFLLLLFVLDVICVIMTKSRSGQLSFLLVIGALTWRRLGWKGVVAALLLGLPVLMLGGRGGEEAESSSIERLGCWAAGLRMWRENPLWGVGPFSFGEHHNLTAHNSFVLTLAEGGPLLLFAWTAMFWAAFKSLALARRLLASLAGAGRPLLFSTVLGAALAPTALSAFFLSIAYKPALWGFFGLIPAFEETVYRKLPGEEPRWGFWDVVGVVVLSVTLMVAIFVYTKMKGVD